LNEPYMLRHCCAARFQQKNSIDTSPDALACAARLILAP
jgi:hypothetical protein